MIEYKEGQVLPSFSISRLYQMGTRGKGWKEGHPQVRGEAVFIPTSFYIVYFASQSSSQSVTKHRGITNSRNGSLSLFCEAACCCHAVDRGSDRGLRSSVLRRRSGVPKRWREAFSPKTYLLPHFRVKRTTRSEVFPHKPPPQTEPPFPPHPGSLQQ